MPSPVFTPAQLLRFFVQLLPHRALRNLPALQELTFYERLFTPLLTLWFAVERTRNAALFTNHG